jgi:regulator of protease activity HflC (stomatin/prohibitin superfamily)
VNAVPKEGTTLSEIVVHHIRDAHKVAGMQPEDFTPVVIVPMTSASQCCCCSLCWVSIPEGFSAIVSRFGADVPGSEKDGSWSSGFHCFYPWYSVNRLVSQQLIIFDTPIKDCKTADNITVNIDVLIVLRIEQASNFVYSLGPEKLDSLLRATQEEVLRQVAFTIPVEKIYDLHGHNTQPWVDKMNEHFHLYGVRVLHFTVRNVQIPSDMAQDFEDKTLYESKTIEKKVEQESDRLKLENLEARSKLEEECLNLRMAEEEKAVTTKAQIVKEVREVLASTDKEISVLEAKRKAEVEDIRAQSEYEVAKTKAEIEKLEREEKAKVDAQVGKLEVDAEAYEAQHRAKARMEAQQQIAKGKKAIAEAEGDAQSAFKARRQQEQELARLEILEKLASNPKIQIATSLENDMGLAPNNSLVTQIAQQGMEAFRMKLAEITAGSVSKLEMGTKLSGGLVRPVPQQMRQT